MENPSQNHERRDYLKPHVRMEEKKRWERWQRGTMNWETEGRRVVGKGWVTPRLAKDFGKGGRSFNFVTILKKGKCTGSTPP